MKSKISLFLKSFLLFIILPRFSFAEVSVSQDLTVIYYDISGNKQNSFYVDEDWDYIYEGKIDFKKIFDDKELFGSIFYRATNDTNTDPQDLSLETFYIGIKNSEFEYLLGDFYSNFSEYSVGNALKGVKMSFGSSFFRQITILAGIDTTSWEDFWEKRCDDSNTKSYVWATRLENSFLDNKLNLNFNYGAKLDDTAFSSSTPLFVNVFSIDADYKINDYLKLSGEYAYSLTDEDRRYDEIKTKGDPAYKIALDFNTPIYTFNGQFSRIYSHFYTTAGFSAQDLESISLEGTASLFLNIIFTHYLHLDRDNLTKNKTTTTKQINPGVKLSFTLPKNILMDLGIDIRKRYSSDRTTNENTTSYFFNLNKGFKYFYLNFGYTKTVIDNKTQSSQERMIDDISLGLDGNFEIKKVKLFWNLNEDIHYEDYKEVQEADITLTHTLGVRLEFPSALTIQAKATISDNDYYLNSSDNYITDFYFGISKDINENFSFNISFERKTYDYADPSNNYKENIATAKISYRF
jgi:hypothetical protein